MKAKGVVRDILEWKGSREYFYWRVKRRLAENEVRKMLKKADPAMSFDEATERLQVRFRVVLWQSFTGGRAGSYYCYYYCRCVWRSVDVLSFVSLTWWLVLGCGFRW